MMDKRLAAGSLVVICTLAYAFSLFQLSSSMDGITGQYYPGDTPVLVLSPPGTAHGTVVIAHGFAANIGIMKPMGYYMARQGYQAVIFDFPGYGNSLLRVNESSMDATLEQVCEGYTEGRYALAGHSLGSYAVLDYGMAGHGEAVIGLSSFYGAVNGTRPRNMLLIAGTGDMPTVVSSLPEAVANGTGVASPAAGTLYGNFSDGTAREYEYVNANHITILFDGTAYQEMVRWLDATGGYARPAGQSTGGIALPWAFAAMGSALVAFLPGLYLLSRLMPGSRPQSGPIASRSLTRPLGVAFAGSLLAAAAVNVFNPGSFTGLMMADRLIGFLLYAGLLILAIDYFVGRRAMPGDPPRHLAGLLPLALIAGIALIAALALPMDTAFYEQPVTPARLLLMAAVTLLTLPFFLGSDSIARKSDGWKSLATGASVRVIALVLLAVSYAFSGNLFFDFVILPVIVPLFLALEIVSYCAYRWTGSRIAGALINALITGWLLASAFPIG